MRLVESLVVKPTNFHRSNVLRVAIMHVVCTSLLVKCVYSRCVSDARAVVDAIHAFVTRVTISI